MCSLKGKKIARVAKSRGKKERGGRNTWEPAGEENTVDKTRGSERFDERSAEGGERGAAARGEVCCVQ